MKTTLDRGYKYKYLEESIDWFSEVAGLSSPLRPLSSPAPGRCLGFQYQVQFPSCWSGFKSNWKAVDYHQGMHAVFAALEIVCPADDCFSTGISVG